MSFLIIPITTLYDDHIGRPELAEKKPFDYIVLPPIMWVGTII